MSTTEAINATRRYEPCIHADGSGLGNAHLFDCGRAYSRCIVEAG